jgi:hypothetical protein
MGALRGRGKARGKAMAERRLDSGAWSRLHGGWDVESGRPGVRARRRARRDGQHGVGRRRRRVCVCPAPVWSGRRESRGRDSSGTLGGRRRL